MKLIIDIPQYAYKHIREYYEKNDTVESTYSYIYHGIPIPDNATNGDVIKVMFGYKRRSHFNDNPPLVDVYGLDNNDDTDAVTFYEGWWNAPYQKGGKE